MSSTPSDSVGESTSRRRNMVMRQLLTRDITDDRVVRTMLLVPRERFVPEPMRDLAYEDHPLSIGHGQTISQPYMVARMLQAVHLTGKEKVLEVGTGSGYQTALLANLAADVISVERIEALAEGARHLLSEMGYGAARVVVGDGSLGWPEEAPYDGIIVAASSPRVPEAMKEQLFDGGKLVIPVGGSFCQDLVRVTRRGKRFEEERLCACVFVKLIGAGGWEE